MKRLLFISVFVAAVLTSCFRVEESVVAVEGYKLGGFMAKIDNELSRTYAEDGEDGSIQMYWHEDDCVAVTDLSSLAMYKLAAGEGSVEGTFEVDSSSASSSFIEGKTLYGVSPYKAAKCVFDDKNRALPMLSVEYTEWDEASRAEAEGPLFEINVVIPAKQKYSGVVGQNDIDRNIMIGTTADGGQTFDFKPVASIARFDIDLGDGEVIYSVKVTADSEKLSGMAPVEFGTHTIGVAATPTVELEYVNPQAGARNDGWALMAPVDWSAYNGTVLYEVVTNNGVYTFSKCPTKQFKAGRVYNFPLKVEAFNRVDKLSDLKDGSYYFEPAAIAVKAVRVTDSTIVVGWTITASNIPYIDQIVPNSAANYTEDAKKSYKVALYSDIAAQNLVVSIDGINSGEVVFDSKLAPPRFVLPGLEPETTYYVKVWNVTDNTESGLLAVTTAPSVADKNEVVTTNAKSGDLVYFENFSSILFTGDLSASAAGVSHEDETNLTSYQGADIKGEIVLGKNGYYAVDSTTEIGLFNTLGGLLDDMGLENYGWIGGKNGATGSSICARSGFLKIGTKENCSSLCLPRFTAIPEGQAATVTVTFKAAPYGSVSSVKRDEMLMAVKALSDVSIGKDNMATYYSVTDYHSFMLDAECISDWKEYTVTLKNLPYGGAISIGGGQAPTFTNRMLVDDIAVRVEDVYPYVAAAECAKGKITYEDGTPAVGVSVSDGFTVVQTGADGSYAITNPHRDAWYIYYTLPADCQVQTNRYGLPLFYTKYEKGRTEYNFTLVKNPAGKENKFSLYCFADPQCKNATQRNRFLNETLPEVKRYSASKGVPCYGVTLGDIVSSGATSDTTAQLPYMRDHMSKDNAGMPIFQTMGNHDFLYFNSGSPASADETSSTTDIKAQRLFEALFGPINYSWERGDVHIVCMRDMIYNDNVDPGNYSLGFSNEQYQWLKQDLALVPEDKMVILCVHIPIVNSRNTNVQNVIKELKNFEKAHIMSGHTHYGRNEPTRSGGVYEHVHGAVCGMWWVSNLNGDGMPNGYGVYDIENGTITDWYYKGVNQKMNDRDYQLRLYRGNQLTGGSNWKYQWNMGDDILLANVFNGGSDWTIKVYENGSYSGTMTLMSNKKYYYENGNSHRTVDFTVNPTTIPSDSSQDWWAIGYNAGVKGRTRNSSNTYSSCFHMYKYTLKDKNATIRVEATDPFGRTYVVDTITTDYSIFQ